MVDATGRDAFLSSKMKLRRKNHEHQSAAIFGHFRGATTRPGEDAGNISIYSFDHGWMWMIPLPAGVMSAGARSASPVIIWSNAQGSPPLDFSSPRRSRATSRIPENGSGPRGVDRLSRSRVTRGETTRTASLYPGSPVELLIGDAFAFLDPVFSSGVYLAMSGAERAVQVVDAVLRDPRP